jgi:hypothetical protein
MVGGEMEDRWMDHFLTSTTPSSSMPHEQCNYHDHHHHYHHHYLLQNKLFNMGKHVKPEDRRSSVKTCSKEVVSEHLVFKPFVKLQVCG